MEFEAPCQQASLVVALQASLAGTLQAFLAAALQASQARQSVGRPASVEASLQALPGEQDHLAYVVVDQLEFQLQHDLLVGTLLESQRWEPRTVFLALFSRLV